MADRKRSGDIPPKGDISPISKPVSYPIVFLAEVQTVPCCVGRNKPTFSCKNSHSYSGENKNIFFTNRRLYPYWLLVVADRR
jgi:hypothetical protein